MVIGVLQFELHVHGAESLKDKRRVVKSIRDRLHREHLVSVAEVGALETLNLALMGVAVVGTDGARVAKVLDSIDAKLRALTDAELGSTRREIIRGEQLSAGSASSLDEDAIAAELLDRAENLS
jgi:hypothetical protein